MIVQLFKLSLNILSQPKQQYSTFAFITDPFSIGLLGSKNRFSDENQTNKELLVRLE